MATIDADLCASRMKRFLESWNGGGDTLWGGATAVMLGTGVNKEDDLRYLKSVALEVWLFGYELPDTLILFTKTELHVVTSGKKGACGRVTSCDVGIWGYMDRMRARCLLLLVVAITPLPSFLPAHTHAHSRSILSSPLPFVLP